MKIFVLLMAVVLGLIVNVACAYDQGTANTAQADAEYAKSQATAQANVAIAQRSVAASAYTSLQNNYNAWKMMHMGMTIQAVQDKINAGNAKLDLGDDVRFGGSPSGSLYLFGQGNSHLTSSYSWEISGPPMYTWQEITEEADDATGRFHASDDAELTAYIAYGDAEDRFAEGQVILNGY